MGNESWKEGFDLAPKEPMVTWCEYFSGVVGDRIKLQEVRECMGLSTKKQKCSLLFQEDW